MMGSTRIKESNKDGCSNPAITLRNNNNNNNNNNDIAVLANIMQWWKEGIETHEEQPPKECPTAMRVRFA